MNARQPLAKLQAWMLATIQQPDVLADAHPGRSQIETWILPSRQQTARERLAVYSHAYLARLLEVLAELFPCVRHAVGDDLFAEFATGYLAAHPPTSYTLHRLADQFPAYLEQTRPVEVEWAAFVVDLARLEQTFDRVFDGPGPEELPPLVLPEGAVSAEELRLSLVPGMELLALRFSASSYYTAWKNGELPAWPEAAPQYVAIFRRDYVVRRFELSHVQFVLLDQIARGGTLNAAIAAAVAADEVSMVAGSRPEDFAEALRDWFAMWGSAGFFASTAGPPRVDY